MFCLRPSFCKQCQVGVKPTNGYKILGNQTRTKMYGKQLLGTANYKLHLVSFCFLTPPAGIMTSERRHFNVLKLFQRPKRRSDVVCSLARSFIASVYSTTCTYILGALIWSTS